MIDRIGPTRRPDRPVVGYQKWRSLLFLHWPVPVSVIRPLVPPSLDLDLYDGVAYVGLVPFAMHEVRPRWAPRWSGFRFLETNVRTYVSLDDKPGVYFFSLDAASRVAVWIARRQWGLPYYHAAMRFERAGERLTYSSTRHGSQVGCRVCYRVGSVLDPASPDSIEFFFLERYLLMLERAGVLYMGQVHHTPYPVHQVELLDLEDELLRAAGCSCSERWPAFAHYSPGVDVEIFALQASRLRHGE